MSTKEKVFQAAMELFIDHGYHGTSIKLIVEKSGVSTGSVYHHFSNKEDIIKELYAKVKREMNHYLLADLPYHSGTRKLLRAYWERRLSFNDKFSIKSHFIKIVFNSPLVESESLKLVNSMYDELEVSIRQAMEDEEIIVIDIVYFIIDMFSACDAVSQYLENSERVLDNQLIELSFRKYWRSIVQLNL